MLRSLLRLFSWQLNMNLKNHIIVCHVVLGVLIICSFSFLMSLDVKVKLFSSILQLGSQISREIN